MSDISESRVWIYFETFSAVLSGSLWQHDTTSTGCGWQTWSAEVYISPAKENLSCCGYKFLSFRHTGKQNEQIRYERDGEMGEKQGGKKKTVQPPAFRNIWGNTEERVMWGMRYYWIQN